MQPIDQAIPAIEATPPPWFLRGDGYVLFYRFTRADLEWAGISAHERAAYSGGLGAIAWMDYRISQVGAYREILFIPGRFAHARKRYHTITRIFVETWESVVSGRANWAIPKYRADFHTEKDGNRETLTALRPADQGGEPFFRLIAEPQVLKLPLDTRLCPVTLMQRESGRAHLIRLKTRASVSLLDVKEFWADDAWFPRPTGELLGAVKLIDFKIIFPVPKIVPSPMEAAHG
jgi:hypothetical protein